MLFGAKCSVEKRTARCAAVEKRARRQRDDDQIHTYPHPFLESPKSHCQAMVYNRYCGKRFRNNACVCFEMLSHDFYVLKCHYWSIYYFHRIQVSLGFGLWILVDLEMFLVSFECVDTNCWHHLKLWRGLQSISIFIAWPSGQHHICITQLMVTISAPPQPIWPAHWALLRSTSLQNTTLNIIINFTSPCAVNKIIIHIDLFRIDEDSFNKKTNPIRFFWKCRNQNFKSSALDLSVSVTHTHSIWSHFHFNWRIRNVIIANFHRRLWM